MMKLAIDIGNSNIKLTVFKNRKIIKSYFLDDLRNLNKFWINKNIRNKVSSIIVCCVRKSIPKNILSLKKEVSQFLVFSNTTKIPIKNKYSSLKTLGNDRLAAAIGAFDLFPKKSCLIIDAGTAITFDIINNKGEYLGGSISPGLSTRYKALSYYTQKLPLLEFKKNNKYPGTTTEESIHLGVQLGILYEVTSYINELEKYYPDLTVLVTGGDGDFFVKNIKKPIFAKPNLIAIGLHRILEHNA
jgi:type III pantothenate kinase